jgi:hypothetical protein
MLNPDLSLLVIVKFLFLMRSFFQFLANSQAMVAPAKEAFATRVMVWQIPQSQWRMMRLMINRDQWRLMQVK